MLIATNGFRCLAKSCFGRACEVQAHIVGEVVVMDIVRFVVVGMAMRTLL